MLKNAIVFINKIRKSDYQTKRFWLFVFTLISLILILFVWLNVAAPLPTEQNGAVNQQSARPSFSTIFNRGLKVVLKDIFETLKNKIWIGRTSIIKVNE